MDNNMNDLNNQNANPYSQPQQPYGQPQQAYSQPQQPYGQPQQAYSQPQQPYGQPQQPYGYAQPQYAQQPAAQPVSKKNAITAMVLGICSIAFSSTGLISLILAIISKNVRKKAIDENNGGTNGFIKAAGITSTIGLIFAILMMIFWVFYFVAIIVIVAAGGSAMGNSEFMEILEELFDL